MHPNDVTYIIATFLMAMSLCFYIAANRGGKISRIADIVWRATITIMVQYMLAILLGI